MPKNLEGFIDPIKMWTKYDGDSKVPGAFSYLSNVITFQKRNTSFSHTRVQPRPPAGKEAPKGERCPSLPSAQDGLQHFAVQGPVRDVAHQRQGELRREDSRELRREGPGELGQEVGREQEARCREGRAR